MRTSGAVYLAVLLSFLHAAGGIHGAYEPVSFAEETLKADLLNKVSTSVFSALEATQDAESNVSEIARSAFKSAFAAVLRSLKGAVADTCNDLAAIAQQKIKHVEADSDAGQDADEYSLVLSFAQSSVGKKRQRHVRPHRFLEDDIQFFGTVQSLAKKALVKLASSIKSVVKDALIPLLPQIRQQAVEVFRKACEEAENSVREA